MRSNKPRETAMLLLQAAALLALLGCQTPAVLASSEISPDLLKLGRTEFPDDDAVVLRKIQNWTVSAEGGILYEEHTWTKLLTDRSYRGLADQRVDFRAGAEELAILQARTHLPDGGTIDVPDYSKNLVAPGGDLAHYPTYADERQWVISFSGVQVGAVLEMHYARMTRPGHAPWLSADLRLNDRYPTVEHLVSVSLPGAGPLHHRLDNLDSLKYPERPHSAPSGTGATKWTWTFRDLQRSEDEAHTAPWRQRCGRLRFTSCDGAHSWATRILGRIERAAQADDAITTYARECVKQQIDVHAKVRALSEKLRGSFNSVAALKAWGGRPCRPAGEVFHANYGGGPETAAVLLAMIRAVGIDARPMIAVNSDTFAPEVPVDTSAAAFVLHVATDDGPLVVDPAHGIVSSVGDWSRRTLLGVAPDGTLHTRRMEPASPAAATGVRVLADVVIQEDGTAKGTIKLRLNGLFVSADELRDEDGRTDAVSALLGHVLEGFKVSDVTSSELSATEFRAAADIATEKPLTAVDQGRLLLLAKEPPLLTHVHLPLARSTRDQAVYLPDVAREEVRVHVEFPQQWASWVRPAALPAVTGPWGMIEQTVEPAANGITLQRTIDLRTRMIDAGDFAAVRGAINDLRAEARRALFVGS